MTFEREREPLRARDVSALSNAAAWPEVGEAALRFAAQMSETSPPLCECDKVAAAVRPAAAV
jgi:hypothetical protein